MAAPSAIRLNWPVEDPFPSALKELWNFEAMRAAGGLQRFSINPNQPIADNFKQPQSATKTARSIVSLAEEESRAPISASGATPLDSTTAEHLSRSPRPPPAPLRRSRIPSSNLKQAPAPHPAAPPGPTHNVQPTTQPRNSSPPSLATAGDIGPRWASRPSEDRWAAKHDRSRCPSPAKMEPQYATSRRRTQSPPYRGLSRSPRCSYHRSPSPRRHYRDRSPSPRRRPRSPSPRRFCRSPSPRRRYRSPSPYRRPPSPPLDRRSRLPSPPRRPRSPSPRRPVPPRLSVVDRTNRCRDLMYVDFKPFLLDKEVEPEWNYEFHRALLKLLLACEPEVILWSTLAPGKGVFDTSIGFTAKTRKILSFQPNRERFGEVGAKGQEVSIDGAWGQWRAMMVAGSRCFGVEVGWKEVRWLVEDARLEVLGLVRLVAELSRYRDGVDRAFRELHLYLSGIHSIKLRPKLHRALYLIDWLADFPERKRKERLFLDDKGNIRPAALWLRYLEGEDEELVDRLQAEEDQAMGAETAG